MKRILALAVTTLVVLGAGPLFCSQGVALVQYAEPFEARTLAGTVFASSSVVAGKGVLIEECTPDWKVVKASTKTDEAGHFSLSGLASKGLHYLRLSGYGFNTTLVKARISSGARDKELSLRIAVGT
jgi:hypothetical protein